MTQRGAESGCEIEHLIIYGGSSDGTDLAVQDYASTHPQVIFISRPGVTKSRAGNEALRKAGHDLVGWLEVDERYNPDAFKLVSQFFNEEQQLVFLIGGHSKMDERGRILSGQNARYTNQTDLVEFWKSWDKAIVLPWRSTFYKRNVHQELGPYNERAECFYYEFLLRASGQYSLHCVAERLTSYHADGTRSTAIDPNDFLAASRPYWSTHGKKGAVRYWLSATYHRRLPPLASATTQLANLITRIVNKVRKISQAKVSDSFNRRFFSKVIETPPIAVDPESSVEVHSLCGKRDLYMLLLSLKSFLRFRRDLRVVIHNDGSLNREDIDRVKQHLPGAEVFPVKQQPDEFDQLAAHDFNVYKVKGVQRHAKGEKVILLDSDMIFINEPAEILNWIESDEKVRLYGMDHYEHHSKYIEIKQLSSQPKLAAPSERGIALSVF